MLIIFNWPGVLISAAAYLPWMFLMPGLGFSWTWLASAVILLGFDLGRRLRVAEPLWKCLIHPGAGGHLFFLPVWPAGALMLVGAGTMIASPSNQALEADVRAVLFHQISGNEERAQEVRTALNDQVHGSPWHVRVAEYGKTTVVIAYFADSKGSFDTEKAAHAALGLIEGSAKTIAFLEDQDEGVPLRWRSPRGAPIRPGPNREYSKLSIPVPWISILTGAIACLFLLLILVGIRRPVLPYI